MTLDIPIELMVAAAAFDLILFAYGGAWFIRRTFARWRHRRIVNRRLNDLAAERVLGDNPHVLEGLRRLRRAFAGRVSA